MALADIFSPHLAAWVIILPFFTGTFIFVAGKRWGAPVSIGMATALIILTFCLGREISSSGAYRYAIGGWGSPLGIDIRIDGLSVTMLMLTAVVGLCVSLYASGYFSRPQHNSGGQKKAAAAGVFFWPLWLFAWGGLNALFLSADIFNIYVTLEVMTFAAIALVFMAGSVRTVASALRYLFVSVMGSLCYLMGVGLLYSSCGTLDLAALSAVIVPGPVTAAAITLITLGLVIKAALFPMHFWLPPAHANAPAPASAVLSALVVMGAFYLLVRFWFDAFTLVITPVIGQVLGVLGVAAILYGALHALRQARLKMLIAYSTVAQVGYMFLMFPLAAGHVLGEAFAWSGGIYFAIAHACAKAAAFMVAGSVMYALGHDRIDGLCGLARRFPIGVFTFAIAGLSLTGLPPSGGFIGKWQLLKSAMFSGQWWYAIVIIIGSLLAAGYIFRVLEVAMRPSEDKRGADTPLDIPKRMQYPALALSLIAVLMGLAASLPLEIMKIGNPMFQ